jgi:hypothetical protein
MAEAREEKGLGSQRTDDGAAQHSPPTTTADGPPATEVPTETARTPPPPSAAPPLTKTKLFTQGDEGSWTEIGVGIARIEFPGGTGPAVHEDGDGHSSSTLAVSSDDLAALLPPRLIIETMEDDEDQREVLLSTPITTDDIYQVQKGTILIWTDPELLRDMAASFHSVEGCRSITQQIERYRALHTMTSGVGHGSNGSSSAEGLAAATMSVASAGSVADPYANVSPWSVTRSNLPALRLGVENNKQRFGSVVRDNQHFGQQLTQLFRDCRQRGDSSGQQMCSEVVYALLNPPYSNDNKILGQLVEEDTIDDTIDAVQYFLGRHTAELGFVSKEERKNAFRNPAQLPELLVRRVHFINAIQRLKDLLPLQLDETDAANLGMLSIYMMRLKYELFQEVLQPDGAFKMVLRSIDAEGTPLTDTAIASMSAVVPLIHDLTTSIRNTAIPFEPKDSLLMMAANTGLLQYADRVFQKLLTYDEEETPVAAGGAEQGGSIPIRRARLTVSKPLAGDSPAEPLPEERLEWRIATCQNIIGRLADSISHCLTFAPNTRLDFLLQAVSQTWNHVKQDPDATEATGNRSERHAISLLSKLLAAVGSMDDHVAQQSLYDCIHFASFRPPITPPEHSTLVDSTVALTLSYWCTGVARLPSQLVAGKLDPDIVNCEFIRRLSFNRFAGSKSNHWAPICILATAVQSALDLEPQQLCESGNSVLVRGRYSAKVLALLLLRISTVLQSRDAGGRALGADLSAPVVRKALEALLPGICRVTAISGRVDQGFMAAILQLLSTFLEPSGSLSTILVAHQEEVVQCFASLVTHRSRRRQNLLYGTVSAVVKGLVDLCYVESDKPRNQAQGSASTSQAARGVLAANDGGAAGRPSSMFSGWDIPDNLELASPATPPRPSDAQPLDDRPATKIALGVFQSHGEDVAKVDVALHQALATISSWYLPPAAANDATAGSSCALFADGDESTASILVGATGSRRGTSPPAATASNRATGGTSPTHHHHSSSLPRSASTGSGAAGQSSAVAASANPYLHARSSSRSQPREQGSGTAQHSIDDEYHALLADFDASVPAPAGYHTGAHGVGFHDYDDPDGADFAAVAGTDIFGADAAGPTLVINDSSDGLQPNSSLSRRSLSPTVEHPNEGPTPKHPTPPRVPSGGKFGAVVATIESLEGHPERSRGAKASLEEGAATDDDGIEEASSPSSDAEGTTTALKRTRSERDVAPSQ